MRYDTKDHSFKDHNVLPIWSDFAEVGIDVRVKLVNDEDCKDRGQHSRAGRASGYEEDELQEREEDVGDFQRCGVGEPGSGIGGAAVVQESEVQAGGGACEDED